LIIAGAIEMPGAAILASTAALRAGCGKVRVAIAEAAAIAVGIAVPELFVLPIAATGRRRRDSLDRVIDSAAKADAVLIGPGMRDLAAIRALLPRLLRLDGLRALVIDATAIPILPGLRLPRAPAERVAGRIVLTPHASEMARLCQVSEEKIESEPVAHAREIAKRFGSIVVLKGAETFVCGAEGPAYVNKRGNVGLATAGSGDVLAGIITGLCARGTDRLQAAAWAVGLHARAGEKLARRRGRLGYLAREIADEIPALLR
jgi:hydroxyethylthiazole kinase-like uncharacterized protein yjeF